MYQQNTKWHLWENVLTEEYIQTHSILQTALYNTELNMLMCFYEWKELED